MTRPMGIRARRRVGPEFLDHAQPRSIRVPGQMSDDRASGAGDWHRAAGGGFVSRYHSGCCELILRADAVDECLVKKLDDYMKVLCPGCLCDEVSTRDDRFHADDRWVAVDYDIVCNTKIGDRMR